MYLSIEIQSSEQTHAPPPPTPPHPPQPFPPEQPQIASHHCLTMNGSSQAEGNRWLALASTTPARTTPVPTTPTPTTPAPTTPAPMVPTFPSQPLDNKETLFEIVKGGPTPRPSAPKSLSPAPTAIAGKIPVAWFRWTSVSSVHRIYSNKIYL
jgi:hypothetical protein